jgi:hypothetical protein
MTTIVGEPTTPPPTVHFGLIGWLGLLDILASTVFVAYVWTRQGRPSTRAIATAPRNYTVEAMSWIPRIAMTVISTYSFFSAFDGEGFKAATPGVILTLPAVLSWKRWINRRRTSIGQRGLLPQTGRLFRVDDQPLRGYLAVISLSFILGAAVMAYGFIPTAMGFGWLALTIFLTARFIRRWRGPRHGGQEPDEHTPQPARPW